MGEATKNDQRAAIDCTPAMGKKTGMSEGEKVVSPSLPSDPENS